ncbi:DUF2291 family protein [Demequina sp. SYSU T00068]|uniref:DUF2291 family protein n=1 Tax=Demequina lignilytica TaxID=3051663 RepID=UPI0026163AC6|nr:DUF2291 family protein [Demequina sp. SYSU T00068]MDN4490688.1 DUF2291 family protein [Demequina sp. SYSU T00068]
MSSSVQAVPVWRRTWVVGVGVAVVLAVPMVLSTTFVSNADQEIAADTAVEYAALNYDEVIVPSITERAVPVAELAENVLADPEGTGEELGRREDENKPYSYPVTATGTVTEGSFGEVGLEVAEMPEGLTVGVAVPPLGSSTALRDAGTTVTFGDFVNQTEYQNVAIELNKLAAAEAYAEVDMDALEGETITVVGAVTWSSKTGGDVTHVVIVPVSVEVGS